jgi:hypothetical protein
MSLYDPELLDENSNKYQLNVKTVLLTPVCITFGNVSAAGAIAINARAGPNDMLFTLLGRYVNKESV